MYGELLCEIVQRIEGVARVEPLLILAVAVLYLAVVARCVRTDQLMPDAKLGGSFFKQSRQVTFTVGEAIGKLGTVVRLDALHFDPASCIPRNKPAEEVRRGIGGLLRVGSEEAQARELVDGDVLEQAKLRICDTGSGDHLHIHLNSLTGVGHLLVRLRFVRFFHRFSRKHAHFTHDAEQALRAAGVAALPQTMPQLDHTQRGIPAAHIADKLQLDLRVLVGVAVGPPGLAAQGRHTTVPALLPEVDIRPALILLPTGAADTVFLCVLH